MLSTDFKYRHANSADIEELSILFVKIFNHREPMTMSANSKDNEILFFAKSFFPLLIQHKLILLAEDISKNEIVGFAVATTLELLDEFNHAVADFINSISDPQLKQVFIERAQFNELLSNPIKSIPNIENEKLIKLLYLGVERGYAFQKVYRSLLEFGIKDIKKRLYTACVMDATSRTSQYIAESQGAIEFNRIRYAESGIGQYSHIDGDIVSYVYYLNR